MEPDHQEVNRSTSADSEGSITLASPVPPAAGALTVYSSLVCPCAHAWIYRLLATRRDHGLDHEVVIDHRPLATTCTRAVSLPSDGHLSPVDQGRSFEPGAGWADGIPPKASPQVGHELVQAAKAQGSEVSVLLDRALRLGFFKDHADVSQLDRALDIAGFVEAIDVDVLEREYLTGNPRKDVTFHLSRALNCSITVSPTVVTSSGTVHSQLNAETIEDLVQRAASSAPAE